MADMFTPGALGTVTPDPTEDTPPEYGGLSALQNELAVLRNQELENRKKSWDMVAQRLEKSRPSKAEMWFSLASALGQPTKTGSFGETLGNTAEALGKSAAERRDYESKVADTMLQRDQDLAELGSKYDLKGMDLKQKAIEAGKEKITVGDGGYWSERLGQAPVWHPVAGSPSKTDQWVSAEQNGVKGQRNERTGEFKPFTGTASGELPAALEKKKMETLEDIGIAGGISADTQSLYDDIKGGKLNLSLLGNVFASGLNAAGIGTDETAKYATFRQTLERMKNDSLRLNKGVQTEGDAERAWNELFGSISSEKAVMANLDRINKINQRGAALKGNTLNEMLTSRGHEAVNLADYGIQPATVGTAAGKPAPRPAAKASSASAGQRRVAPTAPPPKGAAPKVSGPVRITGDADYEKLDSGTKFIGPDGIPRTKP